MKVRDVALALGVPVGAVSLERVDLSVLLYRNEHSWAGDAGRVAHLVGPTGETMELAVGGWYSHNGTITRQDPPVPLAVALRRVHAQEGSLVAVHSWSRMDGDVVPDAVRVFRLTAEDAAAIEAAEDPAEVEV